MPIIPDQPEENFDEAAKKFDLERLRAILEAEKQGEITAAAWRYLKGVLCLGEPKEVAKKCYVKEKTVQVALNREIKDHLLKILHFPENQRIDWSSVPGFLAKAGYRLSNHYTNPPQNIPHTGVVEFVGRSRELEKLHQLLQEGNRVAIAAIAGMGGVGKTELAIQYALKHLKDYPGGVCWLPAKNPDMGIEIVRFARSQFDNLNPPEDWDLKTQVDFCWRRWQSGEVLVVLDDVTDYEEIKPYLPPVELRFKVLMTTRIKRLGKSIESLLLDVLDEADALKLLIYHIGEERIQQELEEAKKLCAWLEFLPLGLELVARYLDRKAHLSLAEMLQRLEEKRLNERSLCKREEDMTAKRGVKAAFELSWETLNDESKQLGCLLSLFAPAPIPWYLVEQAAPAQDSEDLEDIRDESLVNLHLLMHTGKGTYRLHLLIREFFQTKLKEFAQANNLKKAFASAMAAMASQISQSPIREEITSLTPSMAHVAEAATKLKNFLSDEELFWPFTSLGRFYMSQGLYDQAEHWLQQCRDVIQERFGSEHPYAADSLSHLALLYKYQGRYGEAESLSQQALAFEQRLPSKNPRFVAMLLNNFAEVCRVQGRYSKGERLCQQALTITKQFPSADPMFVVALLNNLALNYEGQSRYDEAQLLYHQALSFWQDLQGDDHPLVAKTIGNLAGIYLQQGDYHEAELLLIQVRELLERLLGDDHPDVATSLNNLAALYCDKGRYMEAEPLLLKALELRKHFLGNDHPEVANSLHNLATLYQYQKRDSEAELLYLQALEMRKKLLGEEHPDVAISLNNLAELYKQQGCYSKAELLSLQALALTKHLLGEDHLQVAMYRHNLARFYYAQGRYSEGKPLYLQVLAFRKHLLRKDPRLVAASLKGLAKLYQAQERYSEAEQLYLQALALTKSLLGEDHLLVADCLNSLAVCYFSQDRYSEAEPLYIQALELSRRLQGEDCFLIASIQHNLADLYKVQNRYSEAEPLFRQALELRKRLLGEEHPSIADFLNNLADLYVFQGRYSEAEPLCKQALELSRRWLGDRHPDVAGSLSILSRLYYRQGRYSEALDLLVQTLEIYEQRLGQAHPRTVRVRKCLELLRIFLNTHD
jgi:tetratricopeptide (TPR) repeat protein